MPVPTYCSQPRWNIKVGLKIIRPTGNSSASTSIATVPAYPANCVPCAALAIRGFLPGTRRNPSQGSNESFNRPGGIARFVTFVKISAGRLTRERVTNRTLAIIGRILRRLETKKVERNSFRFARRSHLAVESESEKRNEFRSTASGLWLCGNRRFFAGLARFCRRFPGILAVDQHAIVDDEDDVGAAVAVDVADGHVARFDQVADVAERLTLEDFEGDRRQQFLVAGVGCDFQGLFGRCR